MISLCMIVKDEELNIRNCLLDAAPFVDEIIIVDTGSTDKTKLISREFTDKIYNFTWCDDFAKARNFSISKASNDWILILDADEYLYNFNKAKVNEFIENCNNNKKVGRIKRINYIEDNSGTKKYIERVNRLFNRKYFYYKGIIHEQIVSKFDEDFEMMNVDIKADHIGYTNQILNMTNKLNRNIELLNKAVINNSHDPYLYFQLGKSYFMLKDFNKAVSNFERAMSYDLDYRLEYVSNLIETYGYSLVNSGRFQEALKIENYLYIYGGDPDYYFLLGVIYMNNAQFSKAAESFLKCTEFNSGKIEGVTSFLPFYNIGVIYEVLGFNDQAKEYYKLCGNYDLAQKRLSKI